MLWIEGSSTAWCYLSEIQLKPLEKEIALKEITKIKSGRPDEIEKKADEIRKSVLTFKPVQRPVIEEIVSNDEVHYFIPTADDETIELVDHRKQKSTVMSDLLMTGFIVVLFAGGLYGSRTLFSPKTGTNAPAVSVSSVSGDEHAAKAISEPAINESQSFLFTTDTVVNPGFDSTQFLVNKPNGFPSRRIETGSFQSSEDSSTEIAATPVIPEPVIDTQEVVKEKEMKVKEPEPVIRKTEVPKNTKSIGEVKNEEEPEKKGFLRKLFGKKKKGEKDQD